MAKKKSETYKAFAQFKVRAELQTAQTGQQIVVLIFETQFGPHRFAFEPADFSAFLANMKTLKLPGQKGGLSRIVNAIRR